MKLSIIIPAYNERSNIVAIINEILGFCGSFKDLQAQLVVVDDHSDDDTFGVVEKIRDPRIQVLRLSKRSGSHSALRAGLAAASGDAVLCISADGQDNPEALTQMLEKYKNGAQVVWALRKTRAEPLFSRLSAALFYRLLGWLDKTSGLGVDLARADFFLLDRKVVEALKSCPERNTSLFGLIAWVGFKQEQVEYERRSRKSGRSKWDFPKRLRLAADWIIAFSGLPLRLMILFGSFVACLGFIYALFIVINTLTTGNPVAGWASTMVVILIVGGMQMVMLGLVGEYLWRTLDESRTRPLYFIEKNSTDKKG